MAALSSLLLAGALGALGFFGGKKLGEKQQSAEDQSQLAAQAQPPAPAPTPSPAIATPPAPPDATKAASDAAASGQSAAARTRRRAASGSAGFVKLPGGGGAQAGIQASAQPKTLLGY